MTSSTDTESDRPHSGGSPSVVRRRRGTSDRKRRRVMLVGGVALITVGAIVLGWLAWQFWGTNWVSKGRQAEVVADLQEEWGDGKVAADTDFGKATGILRIPRFGADYEVPILEGSSDEVLAAGVGHLEDPRPSVSAATTRWPLTGSPTASPSPTSRSCARATWCTSRPWTPTTPTCSTPAGRT